MKNYRLTPQSYYANEVKKAEKGWVLSKAMLTFSQDNPKEKLLAEYFNTFNRMFFASGKNSVQND